MKIDRLLGILTFLLERESATAPELADRFEVSRRTILRDLEVLDRAGFPVVSRQGKGGGISLLEGFRFDSKVLRRDEIGQIVAGLRGVSSVFADSSLERLVKRLSSLNDSPLSIDLSSFYRDSLSEKISLFTMAIKERRCVSFTYYSSSGESFRIVEPVAIRYRWSDWYLQGFCRAKEDFRLFKLNRLWGALMETSEFLPKDPPRISEDPVAHLTERYNVEILFDKSVKYLLVESYGPESFRENSDGSLHFNRDFANRDFMLRWILQFGDKAQVLKPKELAEEIWQMAVRIEKKYNDNSIT